MVHYQSAAIETINPSLELVVRTQKGCLFIKSVLVGSGCGLLPRLWRGSISVLLRSSTLVRVMWPGAGLVELILLGWLHAVLGVLLVLGVEVVDGVLHDVAGVHGLLQAGGDALEGHGAAVGGRRCRAVDAVWEGEAQGDGGHEHLRTNEEVLPACRYRTHSHLQLVAFSKDWTDHFCLLKDSKDNTCRKLNCSVSIDGIELSESLTDGDVMQLSTII